MRHESQQLQSNPIRTKRNETKRIKAHSNFRNRNENSNSQCSPHQHHHSIRIRKPRYRCHPCLRNMWLLVDNDQRDEENRPTALRFLYPRQQQRHLIKWQSMRMNRPRGCLFLHWLIQLIGGYVKTATTKVTTTMAIVRNYHRHPHSRPSCLPKRNALLISGMLPQRDRAQAQMK